MRTLPSFLIICSAFGLGGCASLYNKGDQGLTIDSEPAGATVHVNGNARGTTPFQYQYDPSDGRELDIELRLSGYQSAKFLMRPKRNNAVLFADAMLLGIPWIVDKDSPALYSTPGGDRKVLLFKEPDPDRMRYLLPITGVEVAMQEQATLGTYRGRPIKRGSESLFRELNNGDQLSSSVATALRDTWLDARSTRTGTTKGEELIQRAKVHVRPRITGVNATLTGKNNRCSGPVEMDIDWCFYSALRKDSLLFSIPMHTTHTASGEHSSQVIEDAMALAARRLADAPDLEARLAANYESGIMRAKGEPVKLIAPKPIAFEGRKDMLSALVKAVVTIQTKDGHGSGFLISNDGYMITNEHVVGSDGLVKVKFEQGFTLDAQVVKVNKDFDLALLKVQATDLPALRIGEDQALMLGEEIFAIGTPLDAALGQSVSRGILSGKRELEGHTYLQADVSINPGNSGGPFIDETGQVVGVATMKISGKGLEGLGFGVPISQALEMLNVSFE
ncbi:MAG: trypsin-like peptidase domain-containing protein [Flavobacteriales bacterium]|nr:trypsin-like peptidase domain-containing protein [Flavobacteriales bacterium]